MPVRLPQGTIGVRGLVCEELTFILDQSVQSSANSLTPNRIVLALGGDEALPSLAWGDGDSGFFEAVDGILSLSIEGTERLNFSASGIGFANAAGPLILNLAATVAVPTLIPNQADPNTGIGWRATDIGVLVAGAENCMEFGEAGAAPLVAFYGTAAIALQTGVAVSAAGVHAALVNLGLITA